jgi:CrcB protein
MSREDAIFLRKIRGSGRTGLREAPQREAVDKPRHRAERDGMIWTLAQVALGGAIGASARFLTYLAVMRGLGSGFPWGTLGVNVLGSFVMGVLVVWLSERDAMRLAPFLMTGILGGFTTFSAFSLDAVALWERGEPAQAAAYVGGSVLLSLAGLVAGMALTRGAFA